MSDYYNSKRTKNLFSPNSDEPFKISRSKIDLFIKCPRCFYLDRRLGISQPPGYPFSLNSAVDTLLKKEFDLHRTQNTTHPLMKTYGLDLVPFRHEKMNEWRENFKGVQHHHEPTNFIITGAIDDLWVDRSGLIFVVDYKATSKIGEINVDAQWQDSYKRQMEVYQWLMRKNGFNISATGYFVYCNGKTDREAFDGRLEFDVKIIPYTGDDKWVEQAILDMRKCLIGETIPKPTSNCDYCNYTRAVQKVSSLGSR